MTRAADSDPLLGRVLDGKFTLLSVLGRGGMGVVYRAHQASLERSVALKLMMDVSTEANGDDNAAHADTSREVEFQRRFFLEAATAAKLKHPNTITVFDYGSTDVDGDRVFYITMELLDGVTLSKLLSREGPLAPLRAINIALQMCRSLREAHGHGIVHRDLKPGNIMLVKQDAADAEDDGGGDFVKVLDFGLAKTRMVDGKRPQQLTKAGTFLGSPRYVAPEQIEGKPVDGRADIYSFGCVLYRMLTGRVPFDGQQAVEVMLKHLHDPVPPMNVNDAGAPLELPKTLETLVLKCLQKKAQDRPTSMDEVISSLKRARGEITGVMSGNTVIPDELRSRLARELADPDGWPNSGPVPSPTAPAAPAERPLPLTTPRQTVPRTPGAGGEQTSPSQTSPSTSTSQQSGQHSGQQASQSSSSLVTGSPPKKRASSSSQPSLNTPGPSTLGVPGPLSISGEWKIGPPSDESTRPTSGPSSGLGSGLGSGSGAGDLVDRPRRTPGVAIAGGVVFGLFLAGVGIAGRLGHLDGVVDPLMEAMIGEEPVPVVKAPVAVAGAAAVARLRIKTEPSGADVYDVTPPASGGPSGPPRLLGITPLLVPWTIAAGDPSKELLLKLPGHVPARARVEPPAPSSTGEPVTLDVEATLRRAPR